MAAGKSGDDGEQELQMAGGERQRVGRDSAGEWQRVCGERQRRGSAAWEESGSVKDLWRRRAALAAGGGGSGEWQWLGRVKEGRRSFTCHLANSDAVQGGV